MSLLTWFKKCLRPRTPISDKCLEVEIQTILQALNQCPGRWDYALEEQVHRTADNLYNSLGQELEGENFKRAQHWIENALAVRYDSWSRAMALKDAMVYIQQGLKVGAVPAYANLDRPAIG